MRVAAIETFPLQARGQRGAYGASHGFVVKLVTDNGIVGYGETDSMPRVVDAVVRAPAIDTMTSGLGAVLVGLDADPAAAWQRMSAATVGYAREGVVRHAMAAIDIALWDIQGKAKGQPVAELLGNFRRDRLRAYATHPLGSTIAETESYASRLVERGFSAVKFGWHPLGIDAEADEALVAALRQTLGPEVELLIDGGMAWDLEAAQTMAKRFSSYQPYWLEEPLPAYDVEAYSALREGASIRIAAGEMAANAAELERLVRYGAIDVLQVDISRIGLSEGMRIATFAAEHGIACVNHTYSYLLNAAASAHFAAAIENVDLFECQAAPNEIRDALAQGQLQPEDGWISVPTEPGLGVEVDESVLRYFRSTEK